MLEELRLMIIGSFSYSVGVDGGVISAGGPASWEFFFCHQENKESAGIELPQLFQD